MLARSVVRSDGGIISALVRFNKSLSSSMALAATVLSVIFIVLTLMEIVTRAMFEYSSVWSGEVATFAFIWSLFLGAAVCFRSNSHLVVDLFNAEPNSLLDTALRTLNYVCTLGFAAIFTYYGAELIVRGFERTSPMLGVPMIFGWSAPWVMGVTTFLFATEEYFAPGQVDAALMPPSAV
jgi:TRAP-type transport system small permease protein